VGVEHLQDKRTGRPKGSRSTPAYVRALRWASRHLDKPDAVPPNELAGRLLALGREAPDRLLALLIQLDSKGGKSEIGEPLPGSGPRPAPSLPVLAPQPTPPTQGRGGAPQRVKKLILPAGQLSYFFSGLPGSWVVGLPRNFEIVGWAVDSAQGRVELTIRSETFPPVAEGEPIPVL
jgi:hypothetical protein